MPELFGLCQDVHPARPHVRAHRLVDAPRAPVPGLGVVGELPRPGGSHELLLRSEVPPEDLGARADAIDTRSDGGPRPYIWGDITWMLYTHGVGWSSTSVRDVRRARRARSSRASRPPRSRTHCPGFQSVQATGQLSEIRSEHGVLPRRATGHSPSVSWVMPVIDHAEHPPDNIQDGMSWVTKIVNSVMPGHLWERSAIFLTWDDWGGFYDHVSPARRRSRTGGDSACRAMVISPWTKPGFIDHQTLSYDAYLKLIEDRLPSAAPGWTRRPMDGRTRGPTDPRGRGVAGGSGGRFDFGQDVRYRR